MPSHNICSTPWLRCYFIRIDSIFLSNVRYNLLGSFKRLIVVCELYNEQLEIH